MVDTETLFKEKKFPDWFSNHDIFKEIKTIKKVFPAIGLANFEKEVELNNKDAVKNIALQLLNAICNKINSRINSLNDWMSSKNLSQERKEYGNKCVSIMQAVSNIFVDKNSLIQFVNDKIVLRLPNDLFLKDVDRPIFRKNESLFRVYNKLIELLGNGKFAKLTKLENINQFKNFSSENIPGNKLKVIFSSSDSNGLWDIGTMSMRGISSCQSWIDGEYSIHTIGSVIDPFVGIMYLTTGKKYNSYGSKMMRRCIVRFVINEKTKKPCILLDNMYPSFDTKVFTQFKIAIEEKTNFDVIYAPLVDNIGALYLPLTNLRKKLSEVESYQDVKIKSKILNKNGLISEAYNKNCKKKSREFLKIFDKAFRIALASIDVSLLEDPVKSAFLKLKGKKMSINCFIDTITGGITSSAIRLVDKNQFSDSDIYLRRIYCSYFNNKTKIFKYVYDEKFKDAKQFSVFKLDLKNKIDCDGFCFILNLISSKLDQILKNELKQLLLKNTTEIPLDLP